MRLSDSKRGEDEIWQFAWQVWQPAVAGMVAAVISRLTWSQSVATLTGFDSEWWLANGDLLFSGDLVIFLFAILSISRFTTWKQRGEFLIALTATISVALSGVVGAGLLCWPLLLIVWLLISVVWSKYRLSPWRNGVWVGLGSAVSLVLWGVVSYLAL